MSVLFSNSASTTLSAGVGDSATSITVADGSVFPAITGSDYFYLTLEVDSDPELKEIVKCTARSGNTLTIARGQDGTSARTFSTADKAQLRLTAAGLNDVATQADTDTTYSVQDGELSENNFTNADHTKLDGIEASATADQTDAEIRTAVEAATDSNVFTDADHTKLDGIAASANNYSLPFANNSANWNTAYTYSQVGHLPLAGGTVTGNLSVTGTTTSDKLIVGSNSVGSESDIALSANVAINAENSLSFGMTNASTSYYRWMFGNTSNTGGTAGGVEKMKLDPSGNLTLSGTLSATGYNDSNWNTAYGWGNHASAGYYAASNPNGYTNDQTAAEIKALLVNGLDATHLVAGAVGASEIGNDVINSQHYAAGSIDNEHIANDAINSEHYAAGSIDNEHIANDAINSEHYAAGSIDNEHIANDAINSEHYADNSIDALHLNVSGNGTTSQYLRSDGDGTFSWVTPPNTNTTYSVGNGGLTQQNFTNADHTKLNGIATSANNYSLPATVTVSTAVVTPILTTTGTQDRTKLRVWDSSTYGIGMHNAHSFGGLNDYAMTFQMNNDSDRGFWWGDEAHTNAQGAMSLTTDGKLSVANGIRVGFGETNTWCS